MTPDPYAILEQDLALLLHRSIAGSKRISFETYLCDSETKAAINRLLTILKVIDICRTLDEAVDTLLGMPGVFNVPNPARDAVGQIVNKIYDSFPNERKAIQRIRELLDRDFGPHVIWLRAVEDLRIDHEIDRDDILAGRHSFYIRSSKNEAALEKEMVIQGHQLWQNLAIGDSSHAIAIRQVMTAIEKVIDAGADETLFPGVVQGIQTLDQLMSRTVPSDQEILDQSFLPETRCLIVHDLAIRICRYLNSEIDFDPTLLDDLAVRLKSRPPYRRLLKSIQRALLAGYIG